jgi:hypothetical protein
MCDRFQSNLRVVTAAVVSLAVSSLFAQTTPKIEDDSIEPPLLVKPWESEPVLPEPAQEDEAKPETDPAKLAKLLESAKQDAASATRLVKIGVLAKVEAEARALRVVRLGSELAHAQMVALQEQVVVQKARLASKEVTQADVDAVTAALAQASSAAQSAEETYHKAQVENAALNLSRQRKLLKLGSAHKSDVARAEEKLAKLQQSSQASP